MTPAVQSLPELLPVSRFVRLLSHLGRVRSVVGDTIAVMVVELDTIPAVEARHGAVIADQCARIVEHRLREALPADALLTELREHTYGLVAFGADREALARELAARLHARIRRPISTSRGDIYISASLGVGFAAPAVPGLDALGVAEEGVARVRLNGGDATWVAQPDRVSPHPRTPAMSPERELITAGT
jgi:GGDEF domain-containing protein